MPVSTVILNSTAAIRKALANPAKTEEQGKELCQMIHQLMGASGEIIANLENLQAVLTLAPEVEAYCGKGARMAVRNLNQGINHLATCAVEFHPDTDSGFYSFAPEDAEKMSLEEVNPILERLADYAFERVQGPLVRSQLAGKQREEAWNRLEEMTEVFCRPDHLAFAQEVVVNKGVSEPERNGAFGFLVAHWSMQEEVDEATVTFLAKLKKKPPNREFLVFVLQAQIDLGLASEWDGLSAVSDWDDQ